MLFKCGGAGRSAADEPKLPHSHCSKDCPLLITIVGVVINELFSRLVIVVVVFNSGSRGLSVTAKLSIAAHRHCWKIQLVYLSTCLSFILSIIKLFSLPF